MESLFHSRAGAESHFPRVPTAPGRSDSTLHFAASPGLYGQTACNWLRTEQRSLRRSLQKDHKITRVKAVSHRWLSQAGIQSNSLCHSSYIYNRKTGGSDTWWLQTSPRRSLQRWVSGAPRNSPYISAHLCRDLSETTNKLLSYLKHSELKPPTVCSLLTCQGGIEVFDLQDLV